MGKSSTSNNLNQQFVFINKDAKSKSLTRSHGSEKQAIYGHVRRHMVKPYLHDEEHDSGHISTPGASIADRTRRRKSFKESKQTARLVSRSTPEAVSPSPSDETAHTEQDQRALAMSSLGILKELDTTPYARSYFYFRQMTISEATGFSDVQFWNTSLQLSNSHEAIFHALTSLGALHESILSTDSTSRNHAYSASLVHCNRAIRATVGNDSQMPLPLILMTCVIFATIQIFADAPMAQRTLTSGISLAFAAQRNAGSFSSSQIAILEMAYRMMQRYQSRLTLVLQPTTVVREHSDVSNTPDPMPMVPSRFESLLEARAVLQTICDWSFRFEKDAMSSKPIDFLQTQWLAAVDGFSRNTGLHPLSTRSLNLLKIARLASACLIAAQHISHATDFDGCFPAFRKLLDLYHDDFALSKSNIIFTTVFNIDDNVTDILDRAGKAGLDYTIPGKVQSTPTDGESWSEFFFGGGHAGKSGLSHTNVSTPPRLQVQSLDFFARTGMARLRLRDRYSANETAIEERWFSLLDATRDTKAMSP